MKQLCSQASSKLRLDLYGESSANQFVDVSSVQVKDVSQTTVYFGKGTCWAAGCGPTSVMHVLTGLLACLLDAGPNRLIHSTSTKPYARMIAT